MVTGDDPGPVVDLDVPVTVRPAPLDSPPQHRDEERPVSAWMPSMCQLGGSPVGTGRVPTDTPPPTLLPYRCPDPSCHRGRWPDNSRCMCCNGASYVTREQGEPWLDEGEELEPAPVPLGVMRSPCAGCALRPGSPEREAGASPPVEAVFWCHKGMEQDEHGNYLPAMAWMGVPVGYMVCRGWYNLASGTGTQPDELEPFREEKLPDRAGPMRKADGG